MILVGDGDIVLLHDAYRLSSHAAATYLSRLEKRSVLFVTVNDLCALRGVSLKSGTVLQNCPPEEAEVSLQAHR